jgi:hypothetical protein
MLYKKREFINPDTSANPDKNLISIPILWWFISPDFMSVPNGNPPTRITRRWSTTASVGDWKTRVTQSVVLVNGFEYRTKYSQSWHFACTFDFWNSTVKQMWFYSNTTSFHPLVLAYNTLYYRLTMQAAGHRRRWFSRRYYCYYFHADRGLILSFTIPVVREQNLIPDEDEPSNR